jgi:5-methylcytosine-specific restriction endonuclease McrA
VASEVDHIIRLRDGGSHAPANLQSLCKLHHQRKTNAERDGRAVPTLR